MRKFWPEGLSVVDIQSPYEILESAREEWEIASDGVLTLLIQQNESQDGNVMITVHAKHNHSNRTATLLSAIHRPDEPYPITIKPKEEDELPTILKKTYYQPGWRNVGLVTASAYVSLEKEGKTITNEWVSDTPSEFREKLSEAFNLSVVKAIVLNLTSVSKK